MRIWIVENILQQSLTSWEKPRFFGKKKFLGFYSAPEQSAVLAMIDSVISV